MTTYYDNADPPEPPETGRCWGIYLERTKRHARAAAVKDSEFAEWVLEARGDGMPPFKGLEVNLARCEHGVCWGCDATEDSSGCAQCDAESAADIAAENEQIEARYAV
jgi:hypothetical protein